MSGLTLLASSDFSEPQLWLCIKGEFHNEIFVLQINESSIIGKKRYTCYENIPYAAFYKIAYAEPPLKELRFKPPKGLRKLSPTTTYDFSEEHNLTDYGLIEDCLHLSVYKPLSKEDPFSFPVAVWIHENSNYHGPDFFLEENILVVAVSFRTSIFGFLNTGDDFAKGNMAAKDVLMALRWIRENIHLFNGDLNKVTVFGSGIGANIVASLLVSSAADDLFTRLIIHDGSALAPINYGKYNLQVVNKLYNRIFKFKKFKLNKLYRYLNEAPAENLLLISRNLFDSSEIRNNQRLTSAFRCVVEIDKKGSFMNKHPLEVYKRKLANYNVDVMFGYTNLQALLKLKHFINNRKLLKYLNYNFQYLVPLYGRTDEYNSKRYNSIQQKIMSFYFINGTITERSLRRYVKYHSDQVIYPILRQARLHSEGSRGNVFLYRFLYNGGFNANWRTLPKLGWSGATSGDEICYQFKCKSTDDMYSDPKFVQEKRFIKIYTKLLANFIKHGNPILKSHDNMLEGLTWEPLHVKQTLKVFNLGKKLKNTNLPESKRICFWDNLNDDFFNDVESF
ncbi:carboxylesterase 1C-like [Battus philenor]|uniref:carboxylesterase 1C-like n=1 Tax=Battus philenor TaxID=42288 RepID=UPI0035CFA14E